ncbi:MAG: MFS transporter [Chloroflexi bacterium]|nr:MFS transporter [Chloroflexota bacterium]
MSSIENAVLRSNVQKKSHSLVWVVAAATLVMAGFYGTQLSFSVFLKPLVAEFGWTRAEVSAGMSISQLVTGLISIITGILADRYGTRRVIVAGGIAAGLGYLLLSRTEALWQLYLFFGITMGIALACTWIPITALVSTRFPQKRILALGITMTGIELGQMTVPPLIAYYISIEGWRDAYVLMAIIIAATTFLPSLLLGKKKDSLAQRTPVPAVAQPVGQDSVQPMGWSARDAARTLPFWMLMVTGFVVSATFYFVVTHIVAYTTDILPGTTVAALILTFLGGASASSKLTASLLTARIGSRGALLMFFGIQALGLGILMSANSLWMLFAGGAVFGLGFGGTAPIRMALVSELFGIRAVATILGMVNVAWAAGGIAGPVLAGYTYDVSQSYQVAFLVAILLTVTGLAASYFLRTPKSKATVS